MMNVEQWARVVWSGSRETAKPGHRDMAATEPPNPSHPKTITDFIAPPLPSDSATPVVSFSLRTSVFDIQTSDRGEDQLKAE